MSSLEARKRLSACRWIPEDRNDPFFVEALRQAELDPALTRWCQAQRKIDDILADTLRDVSVPPALRAAFLGSE